MDEAEVDCTESVMVSINDLEVDKTNAVKMCSDSQSLSSIPSNLLVYV